MRPSSGGFTLSPGATGTLRNEGTLRTSGPAGITAIGWRLENLGRVEVPAGKFTAARVES